MVSAVAMMADEGGWQEVVSWEKAGPNLVVVVVVVTATAKGSSKRMLVAWAVVRVRDLVIDVIVVAG